MDWTQFFAKLRDAESPNAPGQYPVRDNNRMMVQPPRRAPRTGLKGEIVSAVAGVALALGLGALLMALNASADFCFMITAVVGLGGIIVHEVVTRRGWEKQITARLDDTEAGQEKLARQVDRNSSDIDRLKDGLADTAAELDNQAQRLPAAAASIESRMLNLIAEKLGMLGKRPKPKLTLEQAGDVVLELELAPPPRKLTPVSKLEEALNPRNRKFSDAVLAEMVRNAVRQEKIDLYVQPIMALPQRKPKMMELYCRIRARSGITLAAERYLKLAANDALMPQIDQWLLVHCLQMLTDPAAMMPLDVPCLMNIDAAALRNADFMKVLTSFLAKNRPMASRLVFELPQADIDALDPALEPVFQALSQLGCRFSMDSVRRRRINVTRLKKLRIRFLKLDSDWLLREASQPGGVARINRLKKQLDAAGIDLIVERIETEESLRELLDFHIDYGQGFLFAKPEHYGAWRDREIHRAPGRAA